MSCYFRGLKDILNEAGIEVTPVNKKEIDKAIHHIMGVTYKDCVSTWMKLKREIIGDEQKKREFIGKLQKAIF